MRLPTVRTTLLAVAVLALAGCGGGAPDEAPAGPPPVPVLKLAPLAELIEPLALSAPASVRAPNESQLAAEVAAPVLRVHADVGATVAQGELLLELDATDLRLGLGQAQARVGAAQARASQVDQRLRRARALVERNFVSADEIEALETELQSLQAEVAVARADQRVAARSVEKARVTAPFAGVVTERQAQVGTLATIGMPLLRLVDLAPAEVEAALQDEQAARLPQAQAVAFESQGRRYPVQLLRLSTVVDRAARTRVARLGFTGEPAPAGSSGAVHWTLPARQLPARLLVRRGDALGVFIVADGRARFVPAPGASEGRPFEVDLPATTLLVAEGQQGLNDGDPVAGASAAAGDDDATNAPGNDPATPAGAPAASAGDATGQPADDDSQRAAGD
jgi:RND family efflux transporter MFP subunit